MSLPVSSTRRSEPDFFSETLHGKITDEAFGRVPESGTELNASDAVIGFLADVQIQADLGFENGGDKAEGRMYMHHLLPLGEYTVDVQSEIRTELGLEAWVTVTLDDFIAVSHKRSLDWTVEQIRESDGALTPAQAGAIWYLVGTFLHEVQDYKHRENNFFHENGEPYCWTQHYSWEAWQSVTDAWPGKKMRERAVLRSADFIKSFGAEIYAGVGDAAAVDAAFQSLEAFVPEPGRSAADYRPNDETFNRLFPDYPFRRKESAPGFYLPAEI